MDPTIEAELVYNVLKELKVEIDSINVYNDNEPARLTVAECGDITRRHTHRSIFLLSFMADCFLLLLPTSF